MKLQSNVSSGLKKEIVDMRMLKGVGQGKTCHAAPADQIYEAKTSFCLGQSAVAMRDS